MCRRSRVKPSQSRPRSTGAFSQRSRIARGGHRSRGRRGASQLPNPAFGATPTLSTKSRCCTRFAQLIREHTDEIALLETLDVGKVIANSIAVDVPFCANCIQYYAELADKIYDEVAPVGARDVAMVRKEPLGVVGAIVPWNYPLIIAAWKIGPALVAGNSVVLKPAEQSPLGALFLAKLAKEAGIPDGVLNVVPGFGEARASRWRCIPTSTSSPSPARPRSAS